MNKEPVCMFCGTEESKVKTLIIPPVGMGSFDDVQYGICNTCVANAAMTTFMALGNIIDQGRPVVEEATPSSILQPGKDNLIQ